jgi:hypothetical protein
LFIFNEVNKRLVVVRNIHAITLYYLRKLKSEGDEEESKSKWLGVSKQGIYDNKQKKKEYNLIFNVLSSFVLTYKEISKMREDREDKRVKAKMEKQVKMSLRYLMKN